MKPIDKTTLLKTLADLNLVPIQPAAKPLAKAASTPAAETSPRSRPETAATACPASEHQGVEGRQACCAEAPDPVHRRFTTATSPAPLTTNVASSMAARSMRP